VTDKTKLDPALVEQVKLAAAAAKEDVLSRRTLDALLNLSPADIIRRDPDSEVIKGNAHRPGGWLHAPANLELFAACDRRLTQVAGWATLNIKRVEKVTPVLVKGTKLLVIQAAATDDLTAVPVNRYAGTSSIWMNLVDLLSDAGLTVETGYRERFEVAYVPKGSLLWPGLVIDLSQSKERRVESGYKKKKGEAGSTDATAAAKDGKSSRKQECEPAAAEPVQTAEA